MGVGPAAIQVTVAEVLYAPPYTLSTCVSFNSHINRQGLCTGLWSHTACYHLAEVRQRACCQMRGRARGAHLVSEEPHGQHGGVDDADALALQVGQQPFQGAVEQRVVAVGQHHIHRAFRHPASTHGS